jgi:hypothetical protein
MHACSSIIEHNRHAIIPQPSPSTHSSLLLPLSRSPSPSPSAQLQVPISHHPITISNQLLIRPCPSPITNHVLNRTEIRLFHTLHYLILSSNDNPDQLLSLNIIQLFIYLFIPYIQTYLRNNEKEFLSNSDLIQGMRLIWQPLFEYHQPNIRIFNSFIKPSVLSNDQQDQRFQSPVVSDKQTLSNLITTKIEKELKSSIFVITDSDTANTPHDSATDPEGDEVANNHNVNTKIRAPLVHMNSICSVSDLSRLAIPPQNPG